MIVVTGCRAALVTKGVDLAPHEGGEQDLTDSLLAFLPTMTGWTYRFAEDDLSITGVTSLSAAQKAQIDEWGVAYAVQPEPA